MSDHELPFRLIFGALFFSGLFIAGRHRWKANQAGKASGDKISYRQEGAPIFLALRLLGLAGWITAFIYVVNPAWVAWSTVSLPDALRWCGAVIALSVLYPIYLATRALGNNVTTTVVTRREHRLVTDGPYRWVRHPLYSLGMTFFGSLALLAANWFIALALGVGVIFILIRTPKEEAMLLERFGDDYRQYMQRTGRFFPRLR